MKQLKNRVFACNIDRSSRLMRIGAGAGMNFFTIIFIEHFNAMFFWGLMLTSYVLLLEALWGCSMFHWVVSTKNEGACTVCKQDISSKTK